MIIMIMLIIMKHTILAPEIRRRGTASWGRTTPTSSAPQLNVIITVTIPITLIITTIITIVTIVTIVTIATDVTNILSITTIIAAELARRRRLLFQHLNRHLLYFASSPFSYFFSFFLWVYLFIIFRFSLSCMFSFIEMYFQFFSILYYVDFNVEAHIRQALVFFSSTLN